MIGRVFHRIVEFVRQLVDAIRHVASGGQTTKRRAGRAASKPPRRCTQCHQPVWHSDDWRDHINH